MIHKHHIIPKSDPRSSNNDNNLAIVCPTCHARIHTGEIIVLGVYQTTGGTIPIWFKNGDDPPIPKEFWTVKENHLVVTLKKHKEEEDNGRTNNGRNQK